MRHECERNGEKTDRTGQNERTFRSYVQSRVIICMFFFLVGNVVVVVVVIVNVVAVVVVVVNVVFFPPREKKCDKDAGKNRVFLDATRARDRV